MVRVEVVYGTAERQFLQVLEVAQGCTAREAVLQVMLARYFLKRI